MVLWLLVKDPILGAHALGLLLFGFSLYLLNVAKWIQIYEALLYLNDIELLSYDYLEHDIHLIQCI